jgi:manganese/iron transport system ATP-binding protein/manganese/zinc/iron transport system ATP- binding protein
MTSVTAHALSAGYDGTSVLTDLNFTIPTGQRVALLGPNGGGKSTLIRTLSGELDAISGSFQISGRVGLVPQGDSGRLDWPATALDVAICGTLDSLPWWRRPGRAQRIAAAQALESVGLAQSANVRFGDLSGGQRRRARIAAAMAGGGDVLLLDEPFAGLDAVSADQLEDLLSKLAGEGRTLLIATHDLEQAKSWESVLCLNGHQVAFGAPDSVLDRDALTRTFGSDLLELPDGGFMAPPHHHHDH